MNPSSAVIAVSGAGGFIGGHLVAHLLRKGGCKVVAIDKKPFSDWYQLFPEACNMQEDLSLKESCYRALEGVSVVYNLAADMGGIGFIESNKSLCMLSVLINTHLLMAARDLKVKRFFFSSSACVYNTQLQQRPDISGLKEEHAYPALAEDGYGWEKLFSERMCRHFMEDYGIETRVARYHNIYGPFGSYEGGREKAPAAICRKIIEAKIKGLNEIEIWGDGTQTRSFTFIDDCIYGTQAILDSNITSPINLGSSEMVTINELIDIVEEIAGTRVSRKYKLSAPRGVVGRNSNNEQIKKNLSWEPSISIKEGIEKTYYWIEEQMLKNK